MQIHRRALSVGLVISAELWQVSASGEVPHEVSTEDRFEEGTPENAVCVCDCLYTVFVFDV